MNETSDRGRPGLLPASAVVVLGLLPGALGADVTRFTLEPSSEVSLEGSTNVHDWRCRTRAVEVSAHLTAPPVEVRSLLDGLEDRVADEGAIRNPPVPLDLGAAFSLSVAVLDLDCGNRRMERDLQSALRAAEHPSIRYRFLGVREAAVAPVEVGGPPRWVLVVAGELSLAGRDLPVLFPVEGRRYGSDRIHLRGRIPLKMTDFGIEPPVALLGLVKARDRLTVEVDLLLTIATPSSAARGHGQDADPTDPGPHRQLGSIFTSPLRNAWATA